MSDELDHDELEEKEFELLIEGTFKFSTIRTYRAKSFERACRLAHADDYDPTGVDCSNGPEIDNVSEHKEDS